MKAVSHRASKSGGGSVGSGPIVCRPTSGTPDAATTADTRDPFAAFQALRALLEGIGSPKKQMTPAEHRLTMRLLDIVEPFVGSTPTRKNLITQPNEILDEIVFHIDSRRDLLSFALTCERVYRVIHPRHYEYRVIRAKISSVGVWQHLIDNKALARGVRRVEVLDMRSAELEITPADIAPVVLNSLDIHAQHELLLLRVMECLPSLTSFVWACAHSPISIERLWDALTLCESLNDVEIVEGAAFSTFKVENPYQSNLHNSTSLRSVAIRSTLGMTRYPTLDRVSSMLIDRCPNLEGLDISYTPASHRSSKPRADTFVSTGRWSHLRTLTLRSFRVPDASSEALALFLAEHPLLETLTLDVGRQAIHSITLLPDSLPRLKEMTVSKELATAIMSCPTTSASVRPIECIKGLGLSGPTHDHAFFSALKKQDTVRRLEFVRFNENDDIKRLVECVPKLTWLDVGMRQNYKTHTLTIPNAGEWASLLANLPELTAFHGLRLFYESLAPDKEHDASTHSDRSKILKNKETANVLTWRVPKLRKVDHWEEGSGKIIALIREGEKVRWEVRRVKA